ncbi:hypothetical protein [Mycolicibacterium fortuitum]|uniref:hypothetical protein n=1 Tax=Mycolicibacterium fortuitum TaxID=1766 RepID=UPI0007EFF83F|nr:hypothetical protein [Mycolicibacterium fortuitum]OBK70597.1 hypothetical protein A5654_11015 [Mycolicibacterium fortuitum]
MITADRFAKALRELDGTKWRLFERLATTFLASEFPELRPVADPSGDEGLDALLYQPSDDPNTVVQFSVRKDWQDKIHETCRRIKKTCPSANVLIFVTNQTMGSKAAAQRKSVRENHGLYLDPRDSEWLISTRNSTAANIAEAEQLAQNIVDPLLNSGSIIETQAQALDDLEAKAAFVHLGLQWEDDNREKGLTRVCFEAIVRSVLRDTTSESRMPRAEIHKRVKDLLPAHPSELLDGKVDGALGRLDKKFIRSWRKDDEFCLTWDERERLRARVTELSLLDSILLSELEAALSASLDEANAKQLEAGELETTTGLARMVLERIFLERGEAFASAITHGRSGEVRFNDIEAVLDSVVSASGIKLPVPSDILVATIQGVLLDPPDEVRQYLRGLSDTYTLFAFLRETPDVQSAVVKIFSDADIWLDTSVVLPLLAEELLDESARNHTALLHAASEAGLRLYVTPGVIEEVAFHLKRCQGYARAIARQGAYGDPPFLYSAYKMSGRSLDDFDRWLMNYVGANPEDDVLQYFEEVHQIVEYDLKELANRAAADFRAGVAEVWHRKRDQKDQRLIALGLDPMDTQTRTRLVDHDVENYVGIVMRRIERREQRSAFGYRSWWLTLDGTAFKVGTVLKTELNGSVPPSPAISSDFMINYLSVGPIRSKLTKNSEKMLPLMLNMHALDAVPQDLLDLADEIRADLADLPSRVVRRKIKETLEDARRLLGPITETGEVGLTEEIKRKLREHARRA